MDLDDWRKKRRRTLFTYLLCSLINGMEYNLVLVTIIPYLEELVQTDKPQFFYGLCICVRYFVSMISDLVIGRVVDKSRNVKLWIYICAMLAIVGNLVYSIYFSPVILVIGRAITGVDDSIFSVLIGEIMRTYEDDRSTRVLWFFFAACSVGYTIGSWINLIFIQINFRIGSFVINQHNFAGIFLSICYSVTIVVVYAFAHNCSKEHDIKAEYQKWKRKFNNEAVRNISQRTMSESSPLRCDIPKYSDSLRLNAESEGSPKIQSCNIVRCDGKQELYVPRRARLYGSLSASMNCHHSRLLGDELMESSSTPTIFIVLKYFTSQLQILLMLLSTFVFSYILHTIDLFGPLLILKIYKWNNEALNILLTVHCVAYFLILLLLSKYCITNQRIYRLSIACIILIIASLSLLLCMTAITHLSERNKILLLVAYLVSSLPVWLLDEVTISNLLARMVPSGTQCFAEAVRSSLSRASCIFSSLTIAIEYGLRYWICAMIALVEIFLFFYLLIGRRLKNIETVEFD